mmetsp:Transcript_12892/g.25209  ORF Transcript_12892/g.25209 Transcript_12892/m.25209 type:complete len:155 (+) Transcript_12892:658-1122(+)
MFGLRSKKTGKRIVKGVYWNLFNDELSECLFYCTKIIQYTSKQLQRAIKRKRHFADDGQESMEIDNYIERAKAMLREWTGVKDRLRGMKDARGLIRRVDPSRLTTKIPKSLKSLPSSSSKLEIMPKALQPNAASPPKNSPLIFRRGSFQKCVWT